MRSAFFVTMSQFGILSCITKVKLMSVRTRYVVLFLIFVVLGIYYPCIFSGSNSLDDRKMLNALLNAGSFDFIGLFFPGGTGSYYRPLLAATFFLDRYLWGLLESFMHLENLLLHVFNVVMVYFIALRLSRKLANAAGVALLAALLFGLHPINTESVNWISGRTDVLAGAFFLLSLALLLRSLDDERRILMAASGIAFLLGCLSKEVTVFAYPGLLFTIYCHRRRSGTLPIRRAMEPSLWLSISVLGYFFMRHLAFPQGGAGVTKAAAVLVSGSSKASEGVLVAKLALVCKVFGFYTKKLFAPWPLNFAITEVSDLYVYLGVAVLLLGVYLVVRRDLVSAFLVTSLGLISSSLILAMSSIAWTPFAERYLYLASAPFAAAIVYAGYRFSEWAGLLRWMPVLATAAVTCCGISTLQRNLLWQDNFALYQDTLAKSPGFFLARNELAVALIDKGKSEQAQAIFASNGADQDGKYKKVTDRNRAYIMASHGDYEEARALLRKGLDPGSETYSLMVEQLIKIDESMLTLAKYQSQKKLLHADLVTLLTQMQQHTGDPFYFYRIGQTYLRAGNQRQASLFFDKAYQKAPLDAYYRQPARKLALKLAL
jgi:protein O-mannosyl-transferase